MAKKKKKVVKPQAKRATATPAPERKPSAPFPWNKVLLGVYAAILLFAFFKVYGDIYDSKFDLNGDNFSYYILGKTLAQGEGYVSLNLVGNPPHGHFPPGYPAVIASVMSIFGDDPDTVKKANGAFFLFSIGLTFLIARRLSDSIHIAFATSLFVVVNVLLLKYSTIMMSEVPFMFFSLLCFYLFLLTDFKQPIQKNWKFLLVIITLAITYHVRTSGLALFGGMFLFLAFRRYWLYLAGLFGGFVLTALPWFLRNQALGIKGAYSGPLSMVNPYDSSLGKAGFGDFITRMVTNFERYLTREIPGGTFNFIEVTDYAAEVTTSEYTVGVLLLLPMFFGLYRLGKNSMLVFLYLLGTFGILLLWPDVWYGPRFMIPIIPILSFLFLFGIGEILALGYRKLAGGKSSTPAYIGLVIVLLLGISSYAGAPLQQLAAKAKAPNPPAYTNYYDLGRWAEANTEPGSVIASRKPVMFYLTANRPGFRYKYTADPDEQVAFLKERNVDYVVVEQLGYGSTAAYLVPAIRQYPGKFKAVHQIGNPDTYLFKFEPEG